MGLKDLFRKNDDDKPGSASASPAPKEDVEPERQERHELLGSDGFSDDLELPLDQGIIPDAPDELDSEDKLKKADEVAEQILPFLPTIFQWVYGKAGKELSEESAQDLAETILKCDEVREMLADIPLDGDSCLFLFASKAFIYYVSSPSIEAEDQEKKAPANGVNPPLEPDVETPKPVNPFTRGNEID